MSVVVVLKDKNRYIVGCDTRISSNGEYIDDYSYIQKAKHIDKNKEMIIGCVRQCRVSRLTRRSLN